MAATPFAHLTWPTAAGSQQVPAPGLALTSKPATRHSEPAGHKVLPHRLLAPGLPRQ